MSLERPPRYAFLNPEAIKTYRPSDEQVFAWYTVASGRHENLGTLAARYHVSVEKIIEFNFPGSVEHRRVVPEIVNWYLHHHKGFGCPETHDRKNRIFRGGEKLAIPFVGRIELGKPVILKKPVSLDEGGPNLLASEKFVYEFKIPPKAPKDLGYLLVQARIAIEGEIKREGLVKTAFKKDQIKLSLEHEFEKDLKGTFSVKADEKTLKTMAEEVKKGSREGFLRALAAPFEASLKQNYKFGKFALVPEFGAEFSVTPVVVRLAGQYEDTFVVDGLELKGKFAVKIGFNVGLSPKGWAWVAERVGGEAIKRLIGAAGRSLVGLWEYLVAEGIVAGGVVVAGTLIGTFAITYLTAWIVADARRKGELKGLATWYVSAYSAKVFREPRPTGFITGDTKMRDELVRLGEQDAVAEARSVLLKARRMQAHGTEEQALEAYRSILLEQDGGKCDTAKWRLQRSLTEKSQQLAGL